MPNINPKNILIIRSGAIGDVLMTTPLVEAVRHKWRGAKISYLVGGWSAPVLKNNPNIDCIMEFDDMIVAKKNVVRLMQLARRLRARKFDLCIILDKSWAWNLFGKTISKLTVGFMRKKGMNTINVPFSASEYELEYYLDVARKLGIKIKNRKTRIYPAKEDAIFVKNFSKNKLNNNLIKNKKLKKIIIGIAPGGAENPGQRLTAKRWPLHNYENLIKKLINKNYKKIITYKIILFGGKSDISVCDNLKKINKDIISVAGITNIQQSYLVMKECDYFVTHDSGPMHIAASAGLGKRLIAIFGPTSPKRFAPPDCTVLAPKKLPHGYNPEQDVYKHISPSEIEYAGVEDVLKNIRQ